MKKLCFILIAGILSLLLLGTIKAQPKRTTGAGWQTLTITEDKQNVNITIKAFDEKHPLTKIDLFRFKITGEEKNTKEVIKSWDLTDQNLFSWETTLSWEVSANEFYRLEVQSAKAAYGTAVGFACSNPIWVEGK